MEEIQITKHVKNNLRKIIIESRLAVLACPIREHFLIVIISLNTDMRDETEGSLGGFIGTAFRRSHIPVFLSSCTFGTGMWGAVIEDNQKWCQKLKDIYDLT